ncbi:helix-turn-helix domain-containing protein [Rhodanobacter sp. Col0626]|uniref:helix-turn-helix domain-containing protein n=1 Tax=Rhodanobacter sp. Col0626 TaxID=3415679 RepID=UPI003CEA7E39
MSTDFVEADEIDEFWRYVACPIVEPLPMAADRHRPLQGLTRSRVVGSLLIGTTSSSRQRHPCDRRLAVRSGFDHYLVQALTAGALQGDFNGIAVTAHSGDICIFDLAQPLKSQVEAGASISVALPRQLLKKVVGSRNLHGTVLKADWPMTPLLVACLGGLCTLAKPLPEMQALAAQEALVMLLSAALKGRWAIDVGDVASLAARLRQRIMEFMQRNLYLLDLSPDFLCRRFNVSRAHLYRAFAADGGVAKVLRDMRLDAVYRELTQVGRISRSITEVAYSLGFSSGNQLLRSFRARFGMTPSDAKAARSGDKAQQGVELQAHLACLPDKAPPT